MPIDRAVIGTALPELDAQLERGRLRMFAEAIGQRDPVYTDPEAARAAGYPDLPVPPTFFFSLELDTEDPFGYLRALGVPLHRVLHGEQEFVYHRLAHAGESLRLRPRIGDVYAKKGGALEFLVRETSVHQTGTGELVAELRSVIVVRNEGQVEA